ncbi:polysaccharide lyase family protein [Pseudomonas poae]|uniref:polysaccharide lyase family protein n=1 Tax=Pseudomonas poae TaxID=200451 RepID=UPI003BB01E12
MGSTERGAVVGQVGGVAYGLPAVVGLSNANAQYWARADGSGRFALTGVRPGHYRLTLYQGELEVAQSTVDINAGATTRARVQAHALAGQVKWQIGTPDGTPAGFLNAHLLASAHPSDTRMTPWAPVTYSVGTSRPDAFPATQWRDVNSPTRIQFVLAANELRAYRLRLFISLAQAGGRPTVSVNQQWTAPVPQASSQPDSRGITRGTYRGNNTVFDVSVPAAALHAGLNTLEIGVASGKTGQGFLSPGFVFDSVQWVQE